MHIHIWFYAIGSHKNRGNQASDTGFGYNADIQLTKREKKMGQSDIWHQRKESKICNNRKIPHY